MRLKDEILDYGIENLRGFSTPQVPRVVSYPRFGDDVASLKFEGQDSHTGRAKIMFGTYLVEESKAISQFYFGREAHEGMAKAQLLFFEANKKNCIASLSSPLD